MLPPALRASIGFFVLGFQTVIGASTDTLFLDKNWNSTSLDSAAFFFVPPGNPRPFPEWITRDHREIPRFQFSYSFVNEPDLAGRKVVLASTGDLYSDLGEKESLDWPADSIRQQVRSTRKSGRSAGRGDTATILWGFEHFHSASPAKGRVFLLRTSAGVQAFGGESMTMLGLAPERREKTIETPAKPTPNFAVVHGGVLHQGDLGAEVSIAMGKFGANHDGYAFWGGSFGCEFLPVRKPKIKLSVLGGGMLVSTRLSLLASPQDDGFGLSMVPEIGLNFVLLELTYGYEFGLLASNSPPTRHRFNLGFSFPFYYSGP